MPTIATLSLIPLLATGPRLPEVVVDAVDGVEAAEGQLQRRADVDLLGRRVGDLERVAAAALEVDDRVDDRPRRGEPPAVHRGRDEDTVGAGQRRALHAY